jgi:DNA-3-methyladenine glycosylase II
MIYNTSVIIDTNLARKAIEHLQIHDPILRPVIGAVGPCPIRPHTDYYRELVDSIISQQLSVKAAAAIEARFAALFGGAFPTPEQIITKSEDDLRAIGFSYAKARYVRDLATRILDGTVTFNKLNMLSNEEIIDELTQVKGIGVWTVHMFLMFCMGRSDVLPAQDLGIKNGVRALYGLDHLPVPADIESIARQYKWHPYESIASWYVWQSLKNTP